MGHSAKAAHKPNFRRADKILARLPIYQNLSQSQAFVLELSPSWRAWLNQAAKKKRISSACRESAQLLGWQVDKQLLLIGCSNSVDATQLKQQQQNLIEYLNQQTQTDPAKNPTIRKIAIRLNPLEETGSSVSHQATDHQTAFTSIAESSIRAMEACQKTVSSKVLSASLLRLTRTLRSLS